MFTNQRSLTNAHKPLLPRRHPTIVVANKTMPKFGVPRTNNAKTSVTRDAPAASHLSSQPCPNSDRVQRGLKRRQQLGAGFDRVQHAEIQDLMLA